jgi:putative PIN family toxin of toxin-antitoxin system
LRVVIDTNILLVSISRKSPYNWIFQELFAGTFTMCVSTEILNEYAEIIERHMGPAVADATLKALLELPNLDKTEVFFRWNLLNDPDDNKFSDCAINSGADYLISHDKDFMPLSKVEFPKISLLTALEFKEKLMG